MSSFCGFLVHASFIFKSTGLVSYESIKGVLLVLQEEPGYLMRHQQNILCYRAFRHNCFSLISQLIWVWVKIFYKTSGSLYIYPTTAKDLRLCSILSSPTGVQSFQAASCQHYQKELQLDVTTNVTTINPPPSQQLCPGSNPHQAQRDCEIKDILSKNNIIVVGKAID